MGKIVMLPLDERPCNFGYPSMMPKTEHQLILPPKEIMGKKKIAGDTAKIAEWLLSNVKETDAMVLSLDTLVYGSIVPSRLHNECEEELIKRADLIKKLRELNPNMKLYVFGLIMRCPKYSSSDEEPEYFAKFGKEIYLSGRYAHMEEEGILSEEERIDFDRAKSVVGKAELKDYLDRRKTNLDVLLHSLKYVTDGTVDYFIIPQDDAAPYGYTAKDQMIVREYLKKNILHRKTAMYPSADDTGLTLLARAMAEAEGVRPKVYVHYSSSKGGMTIPRVEDRILAETVKYHILSVNGVQVYSLPEADIVLCINVGSVMVDPWHPLTVTSYDIERNLAEFTNYMDYAISMGKIVSVADIAWLNMGDWELVSLMHEEDLLLRVHSYAGWNTSSNTIGTTLCQAILYMIGKDEAGNKSFLLHRYYEDIGYMAYARSYVTEKYLPDMGLDYCNTDGENGEASKLVKQEIDAYMKENYPKLAKEVAEIDITMPWKRMFEIDIKLK